MKKSLVIIILFIWSFSSLGFIGSNSLEHFSGKPYTEPSVSVSFSKTTQQELLPDGEKHRIAIRTINGIAEFYDTLTNQKFIPRGNNYIKLDPMTKKGGGQVISFSMFNQGVYDHARVKQALEQMHAVGYNTVRIFIESEGTNGLGGEAGLNPAFMDNLADFLRLAQQNQVFAILTKQWLPITPRYGDIIARQCCTTFGFANAIHMAPAGVEAHQLFFQDVIRALNERNAPLDAIFSYEISNEFYFDSDQPPLSWTSGKVNLASGKVYDMSKTKDKTALMDDALLIMIDGVRTAVLEVDPTALVSIGFFAPQEPNPHRIGDMRTSRTQAAIWNSTADFIDLHAYPGGDLSLTKLIENYGLKDMQIKPVILGEFGAFNTFYSSAGEAAKALVDWQLESCKYGFDGWLLWTWDDSTNGEIIPATSENGVISDSLSPVSRPDACKNVSGTIRNLSLGASAHASRSLKNEPPGNAIDGLSGTQWGAGYDATQWIEIDLGSAFKIHELRLQVAQFPEGNTLHIVKVRSSGGKYIEVMRFNQKTRSEDWLVYKLQTPLDNMQFIRIETTKSPSWVAWKEIQILGE